MSAEQATGRPYDVIIVGAGPTGLVLANLLGGQGVSTLVIERNPTTVQEPRAVSIDDESLRTVQASGMLESVMGGVVAGYGSRYLTPQGKCFLTVLPSGRPYGHSRRNAFRQPDFESRMREGLNRFPHITALFGWEVQSFHQDAEGVEVTISGEGETRAVQGRFLVGADGASSFVRKQLGIALEGETIPERWLIVDLENSPAERDTVVFCDIERPCIALPGPNLTRRFEFKLFRGEDEAALLQPDNVQRLLQSRGVAPGSRIVRQTVYTFHARLAAKWTVGRVFLAGDAAHLTPPFAGQGMNSGVRDAHNLAWKLAEVTSGRLPERLLESYELERRDHVAAMIELALRMGRIMGPSSKLSGWLTQTAFRVAGIWPPLRSYFGEMKYKPKPRFEAGFIVPSSQPLVGRLLPQPVIADAVHGERLLDDALPPGFVLFGVGVTPTALAGAAKAFETTRLTPNLVTLNAPADPAVIPSVRQVITQGVAPGDLLAANGMMLLVRPDRYVMAAFAPGDATQIAAAVRNLTGGREAPNSQDLTVPRTAVTAR
ncbi:bifunctional 3-(3-hydroxy-phenyl)propionate/3-hydroxycinnamic acid hydroxylase [Novosphingobium sp. RL4]|uniref:bifunctional 3-(3-hydroxy-phenyl)propionate/3-hydroxycinnamic acid hydroxylase n=1 Tax=Novosphingobium sp. RL4 TaxID=3109595 RepID=UPI002D77D9D2|nr:bifunctional 3-(3-hydroxy-phenyl)propionate/3-hydroxycinnamic acid hydroxylase [Novosphingobium sp. RL4]WRT94429.1 bifunctional 3-(3-hydroxy-phenyl)propionate/3-hydroxycinnamic acid hydroxylase [Novosphingobium sp. RL4]